MSGSPTDTAVPRGNRTPNGDLWAHKRDGFFLHKGRFWSPSMLQEAKKKFVDGELVDVEDLDGQVQNEQKVEPLPRILNVWPALSHEDGKPLFDRDADCLEAEKEQPETEGEWTVPKLEEDIPNEFFPDTLIVYDAKNYTRSKTTNSPLTYKRVYSPRYGPHSTPSTEFCKRHTGPNKAYLDLSSAAKIGQGSHSNVYLPTLTLPEHLGSFSVVAKLAFRYKDDMDMLKNEGRIYSLLPKDLSEHWSGYNRLRKASSHGDGIVPATAVVPKFFGYYEPEEKHDSTNDRPSPILLLEQCGIPIVASKLTAKQKTICYSFARRLFDAGFMQRSFARRNILIQPGPLIHPPSVRSLDTPSFRIVDFGRGIGSKKAYVAEKTGHLWDAWVIEMPEFARITEEHLSPGPPVSDIAVYAEPQTQFPYNVVLSDNRSVVLYKKSKTEIEEERKHELKYETRMKFWKEMGPGMRMEIRRETARAKREWRDSWSSESRQAASAIFHDHRKC